jgi:hypothetical protein
MDRTEIAAALGEAGHEELAELVTAASADLAYIQKNLRLLPDYELGSLERQIKRSDLANRFDISVSDRGEVDTLKLSLDLRQPIDKLIKEVENAVSGMGDIDFKAFNKLSWGLLQSGYYLRHKRGDTYTLQEGTAALASLLNFLIYIMTGKIESNLARVNKVMDAEDIRGWDIAGYELKFLNVKIKRFKNGRLDIKFPKPGQAQKFQDTLASWWAKR